MADVPEVTIVGGIPTGGTGTVQTISNITSKLPASLGSKADAAALAVTQSTEDKAALAAVASNILTDAALRAAPIPFDLALISGDAIDAAAQVPVRVPIQFVTVSMTTPTGLLALGDVVAATQIIAACTPGDDLPAILHSVTLIDTDDQKAKLRAILFDANTSLGAEDAAPDIDDTEILTVIGEIDFAVAEYRDLGGASYVHKSNLGIVIKPATGTDDAYIALYIPDTSGPTYASGIITLRLGFI